MRVHWIVAGIVALFALAAAPASASTIVYQCGEAVCAIDPDTGEQPRRLTDSGRNAGVTADGKTAAWVDPAGKLVRAPVSGGAAKPVPYDGTVVTQPAMSPDGSRFLWSYPALGLTYVNRLTVGSPSADGVSACFCVTTHGWMGDQAIAAFPVDRTPSKVCTIATEAEAPGVSSSCVGQLVSDARGGIGFPNGNAAGTEIVAVLQPGAETGVKGRIVRYPLSGAAPIDVTSGTTDTTPVFSSEGDRIAFERDGRIVVKDLASGSERVVAVGVYPFWGGPRTIPVRVAGKLRAGSIERGRATVRVDCFGPCRATAKLTVSSGTARRLGLGGGRTIAMASASRASAGTAKLKLRATRKARNHLGRAASYRATLRVTVKPAGSGATTTSRPVQIRR